MVDLWRGVEFVDTPVLPEPSRSSPQEDGPERILARMEQDAGVRLTGSAREKALNQIRNGDYDIAFPKDPAPDLWRGVDFTSAEVAPEVAPAPVLPTKAAEEEEGFFSYGMGDAINRILALGSKAVDAAQGSLERGAGEAIQYANTEGGAVGKGLAGYIEGAVNPLEYVLNDSAHKDELIAQRGDALVAAGKENTDAVQAYRKERGIGEGFDAFNGGVGKGVEGIVLDVAANPDMAITQMAALIPVVGPVAARALAGVPAGRVFLDDYYGQIQQGVPKEEAKAHAAAMAGIEYGAEAIPGLKAGKAVKAAITSSLRKAGTTAGEEFLQEAGTEALQGGLDTLISGLGLGSEKEQAAAEKGDFDSAADFAKRVTYAGTVGSVAAGAMRGSTAWLETAAEKGHQAAKLKAATEEATGKLKSEADAADFKINQDLEFEANRIRTERENEDAFRKADEERQAREAEEARQKEIEQEAGFRTIEAEASVQGQTRLDKYGPGNLEAVPINPPAEVTPEAVQAEREQAKADEATRLERVEVGQLTEQLRKRQDVAKGKAEQEVKKAQRKEQAQRRKVMDELIAANPGVAPVDLVPQLRERLNASVTPATGTGATTAPSAQPKAKPAPARPTQPDKQLTSGKIKDLLGNLGVDLAEEDAPLQQRAGQTKAKQPFSKQAETLISTLVNKVNDTSADVQNLLLQGKLVLAPNAAYLRRDTKENAKAEAEFDPKTGKMYLYLDNMNVKSAPEVLMTALHEATHAGQFNDRDGRPSIMKQMMGKKGNDVKDAIIKAAKSGNKIANQALDAAVAAHPDMAVQDLELVPYFVTYAAKARGGFGQLGGAVRDIKAAANRFVREKLGVDLDISLDEIDAAAQKTAGEITKTDVKAKPKSNKLSLQMIAGQQGKKFGDAGYIYKGAVDGELRYEFSDAAARLASESSPGWADLMAGRTVNLEDILGHDELYKNYPDAKQIKVRWAQMPDNQAGSFNPGNKAIKLNKSILSDREDTISTLLHEVQHWVQNKEGFVGGASASGLIPKSVTRERDDLREKFSKLKSEFEFGTALKTLPPDVKAVWDEQVQRWQKIGPLSVDYLADRFLNGNYGSNSTNSKVRRDQEKYLKLKTEKAEAESKYTQAEKDAFALYLRDYGEAEARNTQYRRLFDQQVREDFDPESTMKDAAYNVDVSKTLDTSKLRPGQPVPASESAEPTESLAQNTSKNFDNWFGDSKVVDENGEPLRVYHGTNKSFDTFSKRSVGRKGVLDSGFFFAENPAAASAFSLWDWDLRKMAPRNLASRLGITENAPQTVPVFLSIQKPFVVSEGVQVPNRKDLAQLKAEGYDGLRVERVDGGTVWVAFEPTQVKSAIGNNGNYDSENPSSLAQNTSLTEKPENKDKTRWFTKYVPVSIAGLIDSSAFSGKASREIMEAAKAAPVYHSMLAEGTINKYRTAIAEQAAELGITPAELNKRIIDDLDKVDKKSNDYDENLANFTAVAKKYGAAGEALIEFRNQADELSTQMIVQRAKQGTPLSPEEKKFYRTVGANMGRYAHRQFGVNMGKEGQDYAKAVWDAYANKKDKKPEDLANAKVVANAVRKIVDDQLLIPDDAGLAQASADRLNNLFTTWAGEVNPAAFTREQQQARLSEIRDAVNGDTDALNREAEAIVKEILGLSELSSGAAKYYRGGKVDKGIMQERENIPVEIRSLMGEIKDPVVKLAATVAKQAEFIARHRMLLELRDLGDPEHVQPPGPAGRPEVKGMKLLEGDTYGALQNHYVSKNLYSQITDHLEILSNFEQAAAMMATNPVATLRVLGEKGVKTWGAAAGISKMAQIVLNPMNFAYNFGGGIMRTLVANGNLRAKPLGDALITAADIVRYAHSPGHNTARARRVTSAGVTDSAFVGEITAELHNEVTRTLREMTGKSTMDQVKALKALGLTVKEAYAMMDVVFKIANFYHQADNVLPAYAEAEGLDWSQEEIDRKAADIVNATNVTYKRAAPWVRGLEKVGLTNFGTFFYEVFRTEVNNVRQGIAELQLAKDSKTPEGKAIMRNQGARRLAGQLAVWSATWALTSMLSSAVFGDDDDENRKRRAMLPDYQRNKDYVVVGKDKNGKPVLFDVSRFDPAGPMTDIFRAALHDDVDLDKLKEQIYQMYVAPRLGAQLIKTAMVASGKDKAKVSDPIIQQIWDEGYEKALSGIHSATGMDDRTAKSWTNTIESFLPGAVRSWRSSNARTVAESPLATASLIASYGGLNLYAVEGKQRTKTLAYEYKDVFTDNKKQIVELFHDHPNMNEQELVSRLGELRQNEKDAFDKLLEVYQGRLSLEESPRDIHVELKAANVPADVIKDLKRGQFKFHSVSKRSIDSYRKKELAQLKGEEKEEAKQKWKDVWELLRMSNEKMEEEQ